uniref:Uncharacterized protein n=1 Tax=Strongyloides venezuelensis TaxID=75913 RepID=A0A0K0F6A9_STRVS
MKSLSKYIKFKFLNRQRKKTIGVMCILSSDQSVVSVLISLISGTTIIDGFEWDLSVCWGLPLIAHWSARSCTYLRERPKIKPWEMFPLVSGNRSLFAKFQLVISQYVKEFLTETHI